MKRAVLYLRVSTASQAEKDHDPEGYSIPAQREACLRKAEQLEAQVVDEYLDRGESAKSADRPALKAMLRRIEADRDVDLVIVHKIDRLARSRYDDVTINLAIRQAGAELVSVSENIDDTPPGQLLHAIMAANAEFYSRNLAAEALKGLIQKAKNGGTPTRAPLGYLPTRERIEGREIRTVAVDPARAPLVRWAFEAYATGQYTLEVLLDELTKKGLRSRETPKRPSQPITRSALAKMLHNPYYIGTVRYRGVEYQGRHQPLVSPELFARVQQMLEAHDQAGERDRKHPHYLKGSVFCGRCGSRLVLTNAKGSYLYFFCSGRQRRNGCTQRYVLAEDVERAVCRYYGRVQLTEKQVAAVRPNIERELGRSRQRREQETARARRQLTSLEDERNKLMRAHYAGAVPLDLLKTEQGRINRELTQANEVLAGSEVRFEDVQRTAEQAAAMAVNCQRAYIESPARVRRYFNQTLFEGLFVVEDEVVWGEPTDTGRALFEVNGRHRAVRGAKGSSPLLCVQSSNSVSVGASPRRRAAGTTRLGGA